jgi:hypothetical protein
MKNSGQQFMHELGKRGFRGYFFEYEEFIIIEKIETLPKLIDFALIKYQLPESILNEEELVNELNKIYEEKTQTNITLEILQPLNWVSLFSW